MKHSNWNISVSVCCVCFLARQSNKKYNNNDDDDEDDRKKSGYKTIGYAADVRDKQWVAKKGVEQSNGQQQ